LLSASASVYGWSYGVANTTQRPGDSGNGCASCHGSTPGTLDVQVQGPDAILPGQSARYAIVLDNISISTARGGFTAAITKITGSQATFGNVPGEPTATVDSQTQIVQNNGVGPLRPPTDGTVTYLINLAMPPGAILGEQYTIYAVGDAGHGTTQNGWNFAPATQISAGPPSPLDLTADQENATTSELDLSWSESGQGEHFRVLGKSTGYPDNPEDPMAQLIYEGPDINATATGLDPGSRYFFAAYGKLPAAAYYSSQAALADAASLPLDPLGLTISPASASEITLLWTGSSSEYRLLRKTGSFPSGPEDPDSVLVYQGGASLVVDSGLPLDSAHYYRLWSKVPETNVFSQNSSEASWIVSIHADRFELER